MDYNTRKRLEATTKQTEAERKYKQSVRDYNDLTERYNALKTMNDEQDKVIKDLLGRFERGGYVITKNASNQVLTLSVMLELSEYLPNQDLTGWDWYLAQMNNPLYRIFPFVEVENRQLVINETTLKKYKGAIL